MKVGLIYTSTTPELIELVEQEVKKQLGDDVELYSLPMVTPGASVWRT